MRDVIILTLFFYFFHHLSRNNRDFLHLLTKTSSIFATLGIFIVAHNTRRYFTDHFILLFNIAYLFIGAFDFLQLLAYKQFHYNTALQFALCARCIQSVSWVLVAYILKWKESEEKLLLLIYTVFAALLLLSVLLGILPPFFKPDHGLTRVAKLSEVLIALLFLFSTIKIAKNRHVFEEYTFKHLIGHCPPLSFQVFLIVLPRTDLTFTLGHFSSSFPLSNLSSVIGSMEKLFILMPKQTELASEKRTPDHP